MFMLEIVVTPHVQRERGKVIGIGVHVYVCGPKIFLNRTLEIHSPFQTFAVGLFIEFIDLLYHCVLQKCFPHRVNQGFFYIIAHCSICPKDDTITVAQTHLQVLSFSKVTLELALEVRTLLLPFADQTTSRIIAGWERM